MLRDLDARRGSTIVMVPHELQPRQQVRRHLVAMKDGRVVAAGTPRSVVTQDVVRDVFGLESRVLPDLVSGTLFVGHVGRHQPPEHR